MKLIGNVSSNMGYYTEVFNVLGVQKVENFTQTSESGDTAQPLYYPELVGLKPQTSLC